MTCWRYINNVMHIEGVPLTTLAQEFGTPLYVYSKNTIIQNWQTFQSAFNWIPHQICYAVKANSNLSILKLLEAEGAGFDIVSLGELIRVLAAKGDPSKVVFSGVGKTQGEMERAIQSGVYCFNIESTSELARLNHIALDLKKSIKVALRINPNVNADTHAYITTGQGYNKFGIDITHVMDVAEQIKKMPLLKLTGLAFHIGSQLTSMKPFLDALDNVLAIYQQLLTNHFQITELNIGGGLGIDYNGEAPPSIYDYAAAIKAKINNLPVKLLLEPGRTIVGDAGLLLTRIEYLKEMPGKNFAIVDAGMNDLIRPALYDAFQRILPVVENNTPNNVYDVVGPVCESSDFLGKSRSLAVKEGDLLMIDSVGAYGFSMSSNYNSRCKPAEILVDGTQFNLIRKRELISDLLKLETPWEKKNLEVPIE